MSERIPPSDAGEPAKRSSLSPNSVPPPHEPPRGDDTDALQPTRPLQPAAQVPPVGKPPLRTTPTPGSQPARRARQRQERRQAMVTPPPSLSKGQPGATWPTVPPAMRPRGAARRSPEQSGLYFPWWSLLILVGVVAVVTLGIVLTFSALVEPQTPGDQAPRVQVITAQPTLSQDFLGAPAPDSSANPALWPTPIRPAVPTATLALPTPIPSPTLPPGDLVIGVLVKVVGVGTSGLNIRSSPGYSGTPRFLAAEDEVFAIVDGPQTIDGLEWWRVEDPDDPQRFGWAARNYLMVIAPSE